MTLTKMRLEKILHRNPSKKLRIMKNDPQKKSPKKQKMRLTKMIKKKHKNETHKIYPQK